MKCRAAHKIAPNAIGEQRAIQFCVKRAIPSTDPVIESPEHELAVNSPNCDIPIYRNNRLEIGRRPRRRRPHDDRQQDDPRGTHGAIVPNHGRIPLPERRPRRPRQRNRTELESVGAFAVVHDPCHLAVWVPIDAPPACRWAVPAGSVQIDPGAYTPVRCA